MNMETRFFFSLSVLMFVKTEKLHLSWRGEENNVSCKLCGFPQNKFLLDVLSLNSITGCN